MTTQVLDSEVTIITTTGSTLRYHYVKDDLGKKVTITRTLITAEGVENTVETSVSDMSKDGNELVKVSQYFQSLSDLSGF